MNNLLLLSSINNRIDQISFPQKNYYTHAKYLCHTIFTEFVKNGSDFQTPRPFPSTFLTILITKPATRTTVLRELHNAGILKSTTYSTGIPEKGIEPYCKEYSFGADFIYNTTILFTQFKNINKTDDRMKFKKITKTLQTVTVDPAVYTYIPKLIEEQLLSIVLGGNITNKMITMTVKREEIKKPKAYWLVVATRNNAALIKFKDNFYIEGVVSFIERKRIELSISYHYAIEQIIIGNFYANRNETNNRLDYNLTGLKKKLFPYILLDGQKTKEIDIKNAQFALLANIPNFELDDDFRILAQSGQLYEYIGSKLHIGRDEVKGYLIVVAFGEAEHHPQSLIDLFPTTMNSISEYKNKFGYNQFSIMLQKAESNLMIDGVFNLLSKNKIKTLPVHDSMRVKESDASMVKQMMVDYFMEKEIKVTLKNK